MVPWLFANLQTPSDGGSFFLLGLLRVCGDFTKTNRQPKFYPKEITPPSTCGPCFLRAVRCWAWRRWPVNIPFLSPSCQLAAILEKAARLGWRCGPDRVWSRWRLLFVSNCNRSTVDSGYEINQTEDFPLFPHKRQQYILENRDWDGLGFWDTKDSIAQGRLGDHLPAGSREQQSWPSSSERTWSCEGCWQLCSRYCSGASSAWRWLQHHALLRCKGKEVYWGIFGMQLCWHHQGLEKKERLRCMEFFT